VSWALIGVLAALATTPARAEDSLLRSVAKSAGLATDPTPPADFVVKTRPAEDPAPIPAFKIPEEPPSRVMTGAELKAMDADLDNAAKKHDKLRSAFPPAAKAMAEEEAARKTKPRKPRPGDGAALER
jgi:hypothetical protein